LTSNYACVEATGTGEAGTGAAGTGAVVTGQLTEGIYRGAEDAGAIECSLSHTKPPGEEVFHPRRLYFRYVSLYYSSQGRFRFDTKSPLGDSISKRGDNITGETIA